jgi:histidinol-phosphate aminotransferase
MDISKHINSGAAEITAYTPGKRSEEVQKELGLERIIKMSSNENAYRSSPAAVDAMKNAAEKIHTYPDALSADFSRLAAARNGVNPAEITAGNGADGVLRNFCQTVIEEGDEIIIPEITFPIYKANVKIMRGNVIVSKMKNLRIDTDDIAEKINIRTKAVFFCNPNNPTGDALEAEIVRSFLRKLPEDLLVVVDEAYIDFSDPEHDPNSVALFNEGMKNLFIVRSLSKTYGLAGLRLGYGIGNETLISYINRVKPPFDVSLVAQAAGFAALGDDEFYREVVRKTKEERRFFTTRLDSLGLNYVPSQTNFFLIDTGRDSIGVFEELQKRGIIIRPGKNFGLSPHIRVTLGTHEENSSFFEALEEVLSL